MKERGVDFILCPTYVGVAAELGTPQYWSYTAIWNILDQPAVIFPTGLKADPALDPVEAAYTPRSPVDEREYKKCEFFFLMAMLYPIVQSQGKMLNSSFQNTIDKPDAFAGAPIAVQLVGKHFRDEETVAAADLLSKIVQNRADSRVGGLGKQIDK